MAERVSKGSQICKLILPAAEGDRIARLHRSAKVLESNYIEDRLHITASLSARLLPEYTPYRVD
jgi:50S ribosomal subunit-associated GTPase HflX